MYVGSCDEADFDVNDKLELFPSTSAKELPDFHAIIWRNGLRSLESSQVQRAAPNARPLEASGA